jgi:FixJ family two-component response regulator
MNRDKVVIISGRTEERASLEALVLQAGLDVETAESWECWLDTSEAAPAGCLVLSLEAGALTRPERITQLAAICSSQRVLVLTDTGDVSTAVQAVRQGATHVVQRSAGCRGILRGILRLVEMPG